MLNVVLMGPVGRFWLLTGFLRFRAGIYLEIPEARPWKVRSLVVRSGDLTALVEADGYIVGHLPWRHAVIPGAIRVMLPANRFDVTKS